jgi:hypothetical protein
MLGIFIRGVEVGATQDFHRNGVGKYQSLYEGRVKNLKDAITSAIAEARIKGHEAATSLSQSGTPLAIDRLVSLTANAQLKVFEQVMHGIQSIEADGRDAGYVFRLLERHIAKRLSEQAIEMADYGIRGAGWDGPETQLQSLGAYARVMQMMQAA